mgnify:FL=1
MGKFSINNSFPLFGQKGNQQFHKNKTRNNLPVSVLIRHCNGYIDKKSGRNFQASFLPFESHIRGR